MAELGEFTVLLEFLNNLAPDTAADPSEVGLLLQSCRDKFVNLLQYKARHRLKFHA